MKSLKFEKEIPKGIKTRQFSPFLDEEWLIWAQGRIGKNQLDFNAKHPLLLHRKHRVVDLIWRNEHKDSQHDGHGSAEDVDPRHKKRFKINQKQVCHLPKSQSTNDNESKGRSSRWAVRCCNSIYKCLNWLRLTHSLWRLGWEMKSDGVVCSLV